MEIPIFVILNDSVLNIICLWEIKKILLEAEEVVCRSIGRLLTLTVIYLVLSRLGTSIMKHFIRNR